MWKAPEAMNRMWSVRTMPCLVLTVEPSTIGSRSRCTPWRDTSGPCDAFAAGDLVDLVDEDDARLLDAADRLLGDDVHVDAAWFASSWVSISSASRDAHVLLLGLLRQQVGEELLQVELHLLHALRRQHLDHRRCRLGDLELDHALVELALAQHAAQLVARARGVAVGRRGAPSAGCGARAVAAAAGGRGRAPRRRSRARTLRPCRCSSRLHHVDRELGEVADHRLDVAADVADLGELRRLDLEERRLRELGEAARDLGLPDAGRADHDDVLRRDLVAQVVRHLLAAPAVAQRDGDGALGVALADDVAVELGDDLARRHRWRRDGSAARSARGVAPLPRSPLASQLLDHDLIVGVDADRGGDPHRLLGDGARVERLCCDERAAAASA